MEQQQQPMPPEIEFPDKYSNVRPLKPGQNAEVFRAFNAYLNRDVFIKVYEIPEDEPVAALTEPHLLTELEHANLVRVLYVDRLAPSPEAGQRQKLLIGMDLADGGSLLDLIEHQAADRRLGPPNEAVDLVAGAAQGLAHMHDNNVVHCDIKPANLVLHAGIPKVTDLGLARRLGANGRAEGSRHARIYRPPEVWNGQGYSVRSDIYQLGIVFYQLLGGLVDFRALGEMDDDRLADVIVSGRLVDLSSVGPHVLRPIREALGRAIGPEADRHQTMREFILDLTEGRARQPDYACLRKDDGFEIECSRNGSRVRVLEARKRRMRIWHVGVIDRRTDGTNRRYRAERIIRHSDLASCREFQDLLRECS